jgi:hypothetical protein
VAQNVLSLFLDGRVLPNVLSSDSEICFFGSAVLKLIIAKSNVSDSRNKFNIIDSKLASSLSFQLQHLKTSEECEILGSHDSKYEDERLLKYSV